MNRMNIVVDGNDNSNKNKKRDDNTLTTASSSLSSTSSSTSTSASPLTLDDYRTFQYMLALPNVACRIVNKQILSCIFYDGKYNDDKEGNNTNKDITSYKVYVTRPNGVTIVDYYFCCLCVLPSHILGMSEWNFSSSSSTTTTTYIGDNDNDSNNNNVSNKNSSNNNNNDQSKLKMLRLPPGKNNNNMIILRNFKYSYYFGLLHVDTYHVVRQDKQKQEQPQEDDDDDDNEQVDDEQVDDEQQFHLIEFFDMKYRLIMYIIAIGFYICVGILLKHVTKSLF